MYLYLIRHAVAVDLDTIFLDLNASDESRHLTREGRIKMEQVADRLTAVAVNFDLIVSSPLVRAQQTASILIERQVGAKLETVPDLAPAGNLEAWLNWWEARSTYEPDISSLALIGHEPNLSEWAELLIFGKIYHRIILKKGGIIGLRFLENKIAIGTAQLHCLIPPKYLCS